MRAWLEKYRQQLRQFYFYTEESGALFYVPRGARNLLSKVAYIVPDEAAVERIVRIRAITQLRLWTSIAAVVVTTIILIGLAPMDRVVAKWVALAAAAACFCMILATQYLPPGDAHRGLERASDRTLRQRVERTGHAIGSKRNVWIYTLLLTAILALSLWAAHREYSDGRPVTGMVIGLVTLFLYVPMIAVGPYTLRMRRLREEHERLEGVVRERTAEIEELNRTLEAQVEEQVQDIERLGQLKHFFAAPVADLILSGDAAQLSRVHRREISVVSIDLRGFTAFSESAEPEEVISVLRTYHAELGILVNRHMATLEHFAGDGAVVFLNDPVELADHPQRAIRLASELRAAMRPHLEEWRRLGFDLGMGAGVAVGYATIGAIGYEGRWEYAALGNVCNLANRLCSEATDGQIVTTDRVASRIDPATELVPLGELALKGFAKPVAAFNVAA